MPTDEEILAALRNGDSDASMRALVQAYGGGLYGFALRRLDDPGLAEEVVQEVMERVWRNADSFDSRRGSLRNWVYEIAANLVKDAHRRRSVRPPIARNGGGDVVDEADSFEDEVLRWQVRLVMAQLRPEHREVISLLHFEGLKVREAADRLGLPVGTVKSRSFYALESLRLALEEQGLAP